MKIIALTFTLFPIICFVAIAQNSMLPTNDNQAVKKVISELFNGYREGDSLKVRNMFTKDATIQSAFYSKEGEPILSPIKPISAFVEYIGGGLDKEHDERLWNTTIHIDNNLASVWTQYAFYLDGNFSHCGAENFLLIKKDEQWKVFHLVDTRQKKNCDIPIEIKNRY